MNKFTLELDMQKAVQYHQSGELEKAQRIYEEIFKIDPTHSDALHLWGVIAHQKGDHELAADIISQAIQQSPTVPYYYNNLGEVFRSQGKFEDAVSAFEKAINLMSDYPEAYNNMGRAYEGQGKLHEAINCFQQAVLMKSDYSEAYINLGVISQSQGKLEAAVSYYKKVLELDSKNADTLYNIGVVLNEQGRIDEAIESFKRALQVNPDVAAVYYRMGCAFKEKYNLQAALHCYQKAVQLSPDFAEAYINMGNVLNDHGKLDEAISCYYKVLEINPQYFGAHSVLLRLLESACDWQEVQIFRSRLDELNKIALANGERAYEMPFINLARCADPRQNAVIARSWSNHISKTLSNRSSPFLFSDGIICKNKIRVGYLSADFRDHPVAHLMVGLFPQHNRDEFEVFSYSYGPDDESYYRMTIERASDRFIDLRFLGDEDAARRIYDDEVHILVDLMGHTNRSRLAICAYRPAPVQVTYLGYPGGTGAGFFDYMITDRIVTPEEHGSFYSENFIYMPHSYQANDRSQRIADKAWGRIDVGLPDKGFVFCSFSQPFKIEPVMFDVWMNILRQVPGSVLWLQCRNKPAEDNLKREAESRGISSARLIFAEKLPTKGEHLARQTQADLVLDTRIYNGHTTTSDALWAGVPVITLQGTHFASRVSASLLNAVGLPELITHSLEEYEAVAVRLARNRSECLSIRQKLEKSRLTEPLFDTPRFVENLETAYKEMWRIYMAGERPRMIEVRES